MQKPRRGMTIVELLVVIAVIGILLAILLPGIGAARSSARQISCISNLNQIGIATHSHLSAHRHFPMCGWGYAWLGTRDRGFGKSQPGGWIYKLLPQLESAAIFDLAPSSVPLQQQDALHRLAIAPLETFLCPERAGEVVADVVDEVVYPQSSSGLPRFARTDYALNGGSNEGDSVWMGPSNYQEGDSATFEWPVASTANGLGYIHTIVRSHHVRDGLSNVIFSAEKWIAGTTEVAGDPFVDRGQNQSLYVGYSYDVVRWAFVTPAQDGDVKLGEFRAFGSAHARHFNALFCDGSARPILFSVHPDVLSKIGGRDNGNPQ